MVEILNFEKVDKKNVKGYLDIKVPIVKPAIVIIRKVGYLNNGNKKWFSLPAFTRNPNQEKPHFEKYFEFETQSFNNHLLDALGEKLREYFDKNNLNENTFNFEEVPNDFGSNQVPF